MNKNLLKITTILCSIAVFSSIAASAVTKGEHKPTGQNVTVEGYTQNVDGPGTTQISVAGPQGTQALVDTENENGYKAIGISSSSTGGSAVYKASEAGDYAEGYRDVKKTNRNASKQVYNNENGTYTYISKRGEGDSSFEVDGTTKEINVGNGNLNSSKVHTKSSNYRGITNNATVGQGDSRDATTTKGSNTLEVSSSTTKSGTSATVYKNGQEVGSASSTHNDDGSTTVKTSTGKSKTVTK